MKFRRESTALFLAGVMAVASGRLLQDTDPENITATSSTSFAIDEGEAQPELIVDENTGEVASPDEDEDNGADAITPWRVKPQPLPANYKLTARFRQSNQDSIFVYTVAVAGEDASITSHTGSDNPDEDDPVLYYDLNQPVTCDADATVPTSFMTSKFQVLDLDSPGNLPTVTEKMCWKAPTGYYIDEGNPVVHKKIFQLYQYTVNPPYDTLWEYDGTISTTQGKADVWRFEKTEGRDTLAISRSTGKPISYSTRFEDSQIDLEVLEFTAYEEPEDVPKARLTDEEKEDCLFMSNDYGGKNFKPCEHSDSDDLIQAARDAYVAQMQTFETGFVDDDDVKGLYESYPSTEKEYEFLGSKEEQEKVNGLKSFLPGMVGREMPSVRSQGKCGSCYSIAAAHTISSSYAQENPDSEMLFFSHQHFMNCLPLKVLAVTENNIPVRADDRTGCWGGFSEKIIDMVVYGGGKLPLIEEVPYIGFHGHCDLDGKDNWVDTGITGYSKINTIEEMKNALVFRGDVAISYDATPSQSFNPEDENIKLPPNDFELHEQANLGEGISYSSGAGDHSVAIVGWGPCQVTHCKTGETIDDECWIMQNSWGPSRGYEGFDFVHTDLDCDAGIISSKDAFIPLFEKVEVEANEADTSGGVTQSYLSGLWLCSVVNVALYAILLRV